MTPRVLVLLMWVGWMALGAAPGASAQSPFNGGGGEAALTALAGVEARVAAGLEKEILSNLEAQRLLAASLARQAAEVAALIRARSAADAIPDDTQSTGGLLAAAQGALSDTSRQLDELMEQGRLLTPLYDLAVARRAALTREARNFQEEAAPAATEPLSGTWDVTMGPLDDKGTFRMVQTGTLVFGDYELASGRRGSLQGTFVGGKIQVDPVDARYGRDTSLVASLSADGQSLEGSWEAHVFGAGRPAFGKWKATKRSPPAPDITDTETPTDELP